MKNIIRLTETDLTRIVRRVLNESSETDEIKKITDVKNKIEKILGYYYIDTDNKIIDRELKTPISPESLKKLGPYYKTKIESVLVGTTEDNKNLSGVESIKDEIINGPFKTFIGDYNKIGISKNQIDDYYTDIRCEYFRNGKDKTGKTLKDKTGNPLDIKKRPWCAK